jgi:hypothetical protein
VRRRLSTTTVCLVGERSDEALGRLGAAPNVRAYRPPAGEPFDAAVEAGRAASATHLPYFAFDADPLEVVAAAWARRFDVDSPGPAGELEVAVAGTLTRWRAGSLELPDFYLLLDADELSHLRRRWYLGVLSAAAPRRVVLAGPSLTATLRRLPAGPWWPALDRLLDGIEAGAGAEQAVTDQLVAQPGPLA